MFNLNIVGAGIIVLVLLQSSNVTSTDENKLKELLLEYNAIALYKTQSTTLASWNVATDIGNAEKHKEKVSLNISFHISSIIRQMSYVQADVFVLLSRRAHIDYIYHN